MIPEAYVSFEIAKLLKEKGFDENTLMVYMSYGDLCKCNRYDSIRNSNYNDITKNYFECTAPTHQMTMAWLREIHNIHIEIYVIKNYDKKICEYTYTIMDLNFPGSDDGIDCCNEYKTYEQACESAIKYCLERLVW